MAAYFFDLRIGGQTIEDWFGRTLPDLDTARLLARQEYPRLSRLAAEDNGASLSIAIRGENGKLLDEITHGDDLPQAKKYVSK
jgi:hypothetical protein